MRVLMAVDDVVQHGVPLAERAAFGVLAGEPHRMAFDGERGKRERFGGRPIERLFALAPFSGGARAVRCSFLCRWKPSGTSASFSSKLFQLLDRDAGFGTIIRFAAADIGLPETGGVCCSGGAELSWLR